MDNTFNQAFKPHTNIKTIKEYETEIETLRNENFELKSHLSQNHNTNIVTDDIKRLLLDTQTSINILENENKELKNQLTLHINGNNNNHLKLENEKLLKYIEKMNKEVDAQNERNKEEKNEMHMEINNLKANITSYGNINAQYQELQQQCCNLTEELKRKNNNFKQMQAHYSKELQCKINEYENNMQQMNAEILRLQEADKRTTRTTDEVQDLRSKINYIEQQNHELTAKLNMSENTQSNFKSMIEKLEGEKCDMQLLIEELKKINAQSTNEQEYAFNDLRNINKQLNQDLLHYKEQYNSLINNNKLITQDNNILKNEQVALKAKLGTNEMYISNLQAKINKYEVHISKLRHDHSKTQDEYKLLAERKDYLEAQLDGKTGTQENNELVKNLQARIDSLCRINNSYKKFLCDDSRNKKKIYELILKYKKRMTNIIRRLNEMRNKSGKNRQKENYTNTNYKHSSGDLRNILSHKNLEFIHKLYPNQKSINAIISEISRTYDQMSSRIEVLESELKQITYFAENNAKNKNSKVFELIENFAGEFASAKNELDFCKDYLKEKGKELKELRKCKRNYETRICELEEKLRSNKSNNNNGGFMDFFTANRQSTNR